MSNLSDLNRTRAKYFCTLLDVWAGIIAPENDSDVAGKVGAMANLSEKIKNFVLESGATTKLLFVSLDSIMESENLSCWKTDEHALKKIRISIEKFGLRNPPVVRKVKNAYQLISGSLSYEACKEMEMEQMHVLLINCSILEAEELALIDAFSKNGMQILDPCLLNTVLRFYNRLLN